MDVPPAQHASCTCDHGLQEKLADECLCICVLISLTSRRCGATRQQGTRAIEFHMVEHHILKSIGSANQQHPII
jgi:hypothetical protein